VAQNCVARARARQIRLYIDAIDAAEINPPSCVEDPDNLFRHVRFQGGVSLEDLSFGDGDFSGVVSQFGFEYAQEEQAVNNVESSGVSDRSRSLGHSSETIYFWMNAVRQFPGLMTTCA
jgi:hypothetical protein